MTDVSHRLTGPYRFDTSFDELSPSFDKESTAISYQVLSKITDATKERPFDIASSDCQSLLDVSKGEDIFFVGGHAFNGRAEAYGHHALQLCNCWFSPFYCLNSGVDEVQM